MKSDMRIILTKRLLREGLLRLLKETPISMITVTALCKESGVNRATFYNHYDVPVMILKEMAYEYAIQIRNSYNANMQVTHDSLSAMESSLEYVYERKEEVKLLFSPNAENCISGFGLEIVNDFVTDHKDILKNMVKGKDDATCYLYAILMSSASYGLMSTWLARDIEKTPREIAEMLYDVFGDNLFR